MESQLADRLDTLVATWFGCGRAATAPGTVGSLGAWPVHALLRHGPLWAHVLATVAITAAGFWSSERYARRLGESDPQSVVIDEVAGTLIAMAMVRSRGFSGQLLALGLFRILDITKPGLIGAVQESRSLSLGIMSDDLLAGACAGALARWFTRS